MSSYASGQFEIPSSADAGANLRFLQAIEAHQTPGRLLDIGASYGEFLVVARARGWDVAGVEPNGEVAAYASGQHNLEIIRGTVRDALDRFGPKAFDVVTMFHVLEHLVNPLETVLSVSGLLRSNGICVLRTPNINSFLFSVLGKHWGHLALPAHVYFYSPGTITELLNRGRFDVIECQSLSCPADNEVFELLKGLGKAMGLRTLLSSIKGEKAKNPNPDNLVGLIPRVKRWMNRLTKPFFIATYPFWLYMAKRGKGSELLVIARKLT